MKASLPFKYITAVKGGKHYVVFDYKDNEGKRKRKWVGTDLPENCKKKELSAKVDEIVADFYKEYISGNIVKSEKALSGFRRLFTANYAVWIFFATHVCNPRLQVSLQCASANGAETVLFGNMFNFNSYFFHFVLTLCP